MAPIAFDGLPTPPPEEYQPKYELEPPKFDLVDQFSPAFPLDNSVTFGGDDSWVFDPISKRFDLSRGSTRKLIVDANEDVRDHRGCVIDPDKTVLLVVDMQNYFIDPQCCHHPEGIAAVEPTLSVVDRCRRDGIQVAWLNWGIDEWNLRRMPPAVHRAFSRTRAQVTGNGWFTALGSELPDGQGRVLWKGAWNTELYSPLKKACRAEDLYFFKDRPSGMWSADEPLHQWLRASGKTSILFAGVNTDQCVLGTLTDSYSNGFDCIMINDCVGTLTGRNANAVCDYNVATIYGFVTDSEAFTKAAMVR